MPDLIEINPEPRPQAESPKYTALVCIEDPKLLNRTLTSVAGAKFSAPFSVEDAVGRVKSQRFDLVLVSETFRCVSIEENRVLHELALLPIERRRDLFVIVIGAAIPTGDALYAFAVGADAVANTQDLAKIGGLFLDGIEEKEQAYRRLLHSERDPSL